MWEKKKLLITSNFFFSHIVFKSCLLFMCQNEYLWRKELSGVKPHHNQPTQTSPFFMCLLNNSFENTVRKGKITRSEQFLLISTVYLSGWKTSCHLDQIKFEIVVCKVFQFGRASNLSFGNGLKKGDQYTVSAKS